MKNKRVYILVISLILMLTIILGVSYALLQKNIVGDNNKVIYQVGDLEVKLDETSSEDISLDNAIPTEDTAGMKNAPYSFSLVNNAVTDLKYTIYLEDDSNAKKKCGSECELIPYNFIRYNLSSDGNSLKTDNLSSSSTELYTGTIKSKSTDKFNLRVWLSIDADNSAMGKYYFGKLKVVLSQGDDYCIRNGFTRLSDCMLVLNNHEQSVEVAKQNITAKGTPDFSISSSSDEGLFMAEADDGPSYYYRGAVKNNYVLFAGFMWRIIRQNGDGSVRMIYSGKKTNASDEEKMIGSSAFNKKYWDPTYVGYKYGANFQLLDNNHSIVLNRNTYNAARKYLFASNYNFDTKTKKFVLAGDSKQLIWKDNYQEIIDSFPYSCLSLDCDILFKLREYKDEQTLIAEPISYSSSSYTETLNNEFDSTIKKSIDSWYATNLINYTSYLADSTFCNDRSIYIGTGYRVFENTLYKTYDTFKGKLSPTLNCSNISDSFKVSNDLAKLNYPVALITVNEAIMAGMINNSSSQNYLYTTAPYWTMTASDYDAGNFFAHNAWIMGGKIEISVRVVETGGIRPVININKDVNILKGDGTSISPYILTE